MLPQSNTLCSLFCLPKSKSLHSSSPNNMRESQQQGEILWPRLVANKLFRLPSGSDSFVTDFPSTDFSISSDSLALGKSPSYDSKEANRKVFSSTWNVGGLPPTSDLNLDDWLDTKNNSYDIYVLGFQEIVPLSAKNILGREKRRICMEWNSLIRATLNKSLQSSQEPKLGGEKQKVHPLKDGSPNFQEFKCIISKQMVGILVSIWVRCDLLQYVEHPSVSCIGCGIIGCLGNKGAVSVRFFMQETSFCIVCCHLASGGKEGDEMHRNSDAMEIFSRTRFPKDASHDLPLKILEHDRIILLGDLNYRISLSEEKTRSLVEQKEWNMLLQKDQLRDEVSEGRAFEGWHEGTITFLPTYKYYPNSDEYYGCVGDKKGDKRRAPAWCDRILWFGSGLKQVRYDRFESRLSDHRPVRAIFIATVKQPKSSNPLGGFFSLNNFDL